MKPNLLFVMSDQHRYCDLGCYGNKEVISPYLDAFAKTAARFENCVTNAPVCVPARGTVLTGLMPSHHRAITNDLPIDIECESIADVMNAAGYHTGYIGKWHLGGVPRDKPIQAEERLGFTEWKAFNCSHDYMAASYYDENNRRIKPEGYEPEWQTDLAVDFIRRNSAVDTGRPWGLALCFGTPHDPYFSQPTSNLACYSGVQPTLRANVSDEVVTGKACLSREEIQHNYVGYYAHITALDRQFGRLLEALQTTGQQDSTLVVYTSDHGDMLGSHGYLNKQLPYAEALRVPLLAKLTGVIATGTRDTVISLADLPVSLMGLMGLRFQEAPDGSDLSALFTDTHASGKDCAYIMDLVPCHQAMARNGTEWRGIKTRRYTYARNYNGEFRVLFDDIADPFQFVNLADDTTAAAELEARMMALVERYDRFLPWQEYIIHEGYRDAWNRSQAYFKLPLL